MSNVGILGLGAYLPSKKLTNFDLEKIVETTDEWIRSRTGIVERRIASASEQTSDLAVKAALEAIKNSKISPEKIELIIVATVTPDHPYPATADIVADMIGATNAWGFDVQAACSSFLSALTMPTDRLGHIIFIFSTACWSNSQVGTSTNDRHRISTMR